MKNADIQFPYGATSATDVVANTSDTKGVGDGISSTCSFLQLISIVKGPLYKAPHPRATMAPRQRTYMGLESHRPYTKLIMRDVSCASVCTVGEPLALPVCMGALTLRSLLLVVCTLSAAVGGTKATCDCSIARFA